MRKHSELVLLFPLFPIFLLGLLPMLVFPFAGFAGLGIAGGLLIESGIAESLRVMTEHNERIIVRGHSGRSDQARHLSSFKSDLRWAKRLSAAGLSIACIAIAGLYWT